ncbi:PQQ-dependent dehydrogenase, methanol/ethanol family [Palleronia marisminoris]|uniref:Methanol dehydrogenase [cytochrome c] subunit 1 n=1 Tax=Palleronia marisminoris TaxID=315423 RepID=A0A1Y5SDN1_9RHOB|nr:methanol/ethanol family PQQ-dependent dehydrogenase [Palleronia marisminoris]SFG71946.1 PQQ-dependent dehydrogenase, methanol/ethanol family [Palleronia marisminoris]SLN36795.1 Methanol dehydrogenase [cytochrome c] subunit 1 precursor [Palleronia marisminoris]
MKSGLLGAVSIAAVTAVAWSASANEQLQTMAEEQPGEWVMPTGNYANWRYSELDQIDKDNVDQLQVAWSMSTGVLRGHEGNPLVIGDTMYFSTPFPNNVFAVDLANDGIIKWKYEPQQDPQVIGVMCCDTVNRGVAYAPETDAYPATIILNQADTTVVALSADTGQVLWEVQNGDPGKGETATMAPQVVKDKVLVGNSGGEYGVLGHMTAYDIATGEVAWRAFSAGPDDMTLLDPENTTHLGEPVGVDSGTATWEGDQWQIGGGTTWGWISYDPELDLVYYGTGNPSTWNPAQRPGDNRWSMTIMARDPDDGMAKWLYQMTPHDEWDYDGVNEMILADLDFEGEERKVVVHPDRNGFAYTLDRETGELLVAEKYDPFVNWATHVEMDPESDQYGRPQVVAEYSTEQGGEDTNTAGICPAALGTKDQQPSAYSPETKLFYIPTNHVCMDYEPFRVSYTAGQPYVGATLSMYPTPESHGGMGNFIAWDAVNGEIVWSIPEQFSVWSGALATAGDVVFYGTLEGYLKAVDMETGEELYRFKTGSGVIGNVMTYEHEGEQYIAVLSGVGGWAGIGLAAGLTDPAAGLGAVGGYASLSDYTNLGGQLTVFKLPEEVASSE